MNKYLRVGLLLLGAPVISHAGVHVHVGGGYYYGYHAPRAYYYAPYYGYYGPAYYSPGYYYPPPAAVYEEPETVVVQPPAEYRYYCAAAKNYYPTVTSCLDGWEAVPAQTPAQAKSGDPAPATARMSSPSQSPAGSVVYRFGDLLFSTGKADLKTNAQGSLAMMLTAIQHGNAHHITIEVHTDSSGNAAANLELSRRRAEAVKIYLVNHGIPAESINVVGKGSDAPIGDNGTSDGRKMNRRVDVIVG